MFLLSDVLTNWVLEPDCKTPKMALISEYSAADLSPDASADALAIIDIGFV